MKVFRKLKLASWLMTAAALLCASFVQAAAPSLLQYQGKLTDADGFPVADGDYTFVFKLGTEDGSTIIYDSGDVALTTEAGVYSTELGPIDPVGLATNEIYLHLSVNGEVFDPVALNSVAYSLISEWSASVADGSITESSLADGAVSSGKLAGEVTDVLTNVSVIESDVAVINDTLYDPDNGIVSPVTNFVQALTVPTPTDQSLDLVIGRPIDADSDPTNGFSPVANPFNFSGGTLAAAPAAAAAGDPHYPLTYTILTVDGVAPASNQIIPGVTFNSTTNIVSGTPTIVAGETYPKTYQLVVEAENVLGKKTTGNVAITVHNVIPTDELTAVIVDNFTNAPVNTPDAGDAYTFQFGVDPSANLIPMTPNVSFNIIQTSIGTLNDDSGAALAGLYNPPNAISQQLAVGTMSGVNFTEANGIYSYTIPAMLDIDFAGSFLPNVENETHEGDYHVKVMFNWGQVILVDTDMDANDINDLDPWRVSDVRDRFTVGPVSITSTPNTIAQGQTQQAATSSSFNTLGAGNFQPGFNGTARTLWFRQDLWQVNDPVNYIQGVGSDLLTLPIPSDLSVTQPAPNSPNPVGLVETKGSGLWGHGQSNITGPASSPAPKPPFLSGDDVIYTAAVFNGFADAFAALNPSSFAIGPYQRVSDNITILTSPIDRNDFAGYTAAFSANAEAFPQNLVDPKYNWSITNAQGVLVVPTSTQPDDSAISIPGNLLSYNGSNGIHTPYGVLLTVESTDGTIVYSSESEGVFSIARPNIQLFPEVNTAADWNQDADAALEIDPFAFNFGVDLINNVGALPVTGNPLDLDGNGAGNPSNARLSRVVNSDPATEVTMVARFYVPASVLNPTEDNGSLTALGTVADAATAWPAGYSVAWYVDIDVGNDGSIDLTRVRVLNTEASVAIRQTTGEFVDEFAIENNSQVTVGNQVVPATVPQPSERGILHAQLNLVNPLSAATAGNNTATGYYYAEVMTPYGMFSTRDLHDQAINDYSSWPTANLGDLVLTVEP